MRDLGLTEDYTEGAPICRWRRGDLIIDVMPTDERILGFSNRWYMPALGSAKHVEIAGLRPRVVTAIYFLAMKLEAFRGRGDDDIISSHDLEDLITVIDGRSEIVDELRLATAGVRSYVGSELRQLLGRREFIDALPGFLLPDPASQERRQILLARLTAIAALLTDRLAASPQAKADSRGLNKRPRHLHEVHHASLRQSGWDEMTQLREEVSFTRGCIIVRGKLVTRGKARRADYILYYKPTIPLALIEAKDNNCTVGEPCLPRQPTPCVARAAFRRG